METPPRLWGRRQCGRSDLGPVGNTPTPVGKTQHRASELRASRKHPHACGEDRTIGLEIVQNMETPPRLWGRPDYDAMFSETLGNTPTPVGKTREYLRAWRQCKKHPHACGEDHLVQSIIAFRHGNTPTPVGKTAVFCCNFILEWKHPHACGEDGYRRVHRAQRKETPPRLWGRRRGP